MQTKRFGLAFLLLLAAAASIVMYSCKKEASSNQALKTTQQTSKLSLYLTDDPVDSVQQVNIDIKAIYVKVDTCSHMWGPDRPMPGCDRYKDRINSPCEIWDTLNFAAGVYDVASLRNGLDTLLTTSNIPSGKIQRVKVALGDSNSVVLVNGASKPIHFLNNQDYFYVNVGRSHIDSLGTRHYRLLLDFDLYHSLRVQQGRYHCSPVVRPYSRVNTGIIFGHVHPVQGWSQVYAYNNVDTFYARPEKKDGMFKIGGLPQGSYSLSIKGTNGFKDTTIANIQVAIGREQRLNTIYLRR